ncbi:MAG: FliI/YscN family ATPase, partial [Zetaproteobacteria bacterium]|nr:FliI/YscN family ATPase [Zetaproteobacteria bacterium]
VAERVSQGIDDFGFREGTALIISYSDLTGVNPQSTIQIVEKQAKVFCHDQLLGKVIDPFMHDLKSTHHIKSPKSGRWMPLDASCPNPMNRARITQPLALGVRAIDGLLTCGEGQRLAILAGSGVGKSVLLGMIARGCRSDINVIGLIGERGREVREFVEREIGEEALKRSVIVTATSDQSPLLRIRAAKVATCIAEYFSQQGRRVLLMMDSLTRVAQAQREVGLSIGEIPAAKAYPPSVFAMMPKLLERAGPQPFGYGAISGVYTVLAEGDDLYDPITDSARSILDGHIHLSRKLAAKNHFPAIDICASISRSMSDITPSSHMTLAKKIKRLLAIYEEQIDLIQLGGYQKGLLPELDEAIEKLPAIESFLRQSMEHVVSFEQTIQALIQVVHGTHKEDDGEETTTNQATSA